MIDARSLGTFLRGLPPLPNGPRGGLYTVVADLRGPAATPPPGASTQDLYVWAEANVSAGRVADGLLAGALAAAHLAAPGVAVLLRRARAALRAGRGDVLEPLLLDLYADAQAAASRRPENLPARARAHYHAVDAAWTALGAALAVASGRGLVGGYHGLAAASLSLTAGGADPAAAADAFALAVGGP